MIYKVNETDTRNRSCWQRRTRMERFGIVFIIIAVLLIIGFIAVLALVVPKKLENGTESDTQQKTICESSGCIHAASNTIRYIDPSQNPCEDFYQFACGTYLKETTIPDDEMELNSFSTVYDVLRGQLKAMVEEPIKPKEARPFVLLKNLYKICMNTSAIEAESLTTFKNALKNLGGAPILEGKTWDEKKFDWKKTVYKFRQYGLSTNSFIALDILPDAMNSSRRLIHIDQPGLGLGGRETWLKGLNNSIVAAYYDYMVDVAVMLGAQREFAKSEVQTVISFRQQLANISIPKENRRNSSLLYNPMTIVELQKHYPTIPWLKYVNNIIALPQKMKENDTVIVIAPQFIGALEKLLKITPKRVQANHALFGAISFVEILLPEEFRNRQQQFSSQYSGTPTRTSRWKECTGIASSTFNLAAGSLYVRTYFNKDSKKYATEMVSDIRNELIKTIKQLDWMDEVTKKKAVDKALALTAHVGYTDELLDDQKLEDYYSDLTITGDNYIMFMANYSAFATTKMFKELWDPINKTDWTQRASPITVNAFYSSNENSIQFPAAILQSIFFNKDRLRSMNYGAIGSIIGHEFTHAFDDEGKQYDKDGNLINWWADATDEAFMKKAKCIIQQYGSYTVPEVGLKLNGINTQGENIADNGGVKHAYLAYKSWVDRNGPELKLPGLNYTAEQMFWISSAISWCTKNRKESLKQDVLTDSHSPAPYRILIPFGNSEYFAKDFNCPLGSKMNPKHKCHVW